MDTLPEIARPVENELRTVEEIIFSCLSSAEEKLGELERYTLESKGKRIRSAVTLLSGAVAAQLREANLYLAAASELIHMATVVHDDVIDEAAVRRGKATINASWGNQVAVLFGDYLLSQAFGILCRSENSGILPDMIRMTREVCEGEIYQLRRRYDISMTEDEYRGTVSMKTASLFSTCCRLSASLAGASRPIQESLSQFGRRFGIAYQIVDDCLDISEENRGKDRFKDIEGGRVTLPLIKALAALSGEERERLAIAFRGGEVNKCRRAIAAAGAIAACRRDAEILLDQARNDLSPLPDSPCRDALIRLTHFLLGAP
jgi:octaprenyl-diphosphate synthase